MNVWILHLAAPGMSSAEARAGDTLPLPLSADTDYTAFSGQQALKTHLREANTDTPPEALNRMADKIWHVLTSLHEEDIIAVPFQREEEVLFAQVTGRVRHNAPRFEVQIRWFERSAAIQNFRRFRPLFDPRPEGALVEVREAAARAKIRDRLPLPGNRFRKLKWLIIIVIAIKLVMIGFNMWRQETAGF